MWVEFLECQGCQSGMVIEKTVITAPVGTLTEPTIRGYSLLKALSFSIAARNALCAPKEVLRGRFH
jgi:hypothetical protein